MIVGRTPAPAMICLKSSLAHWKIQNHLGCLTPKKKLGLEPGDELYFYVEAYDNRTPTANHNRTETYFIAVQDTAAEITTADAGLGVDLMPEYFRSQRQIIIDTEKLLKEKKKLTRQQFNNTSNELGYDQKVLRLRYGQFMGEEAESGIGISVTQEQVSEPEDEKDKDVTKEFSHQHDTENEHNLVDQKKQAPGGHDNTEEATFFDQSIKAKLKAALTIMWDAELYLRLYEPAKSLPYQYKVLNLLKEISNDSRIYVHRTGFDPPPLKEDRRLTAELTEIKSSRDEHNGTTEDMYPGVREALGVVEEMLQNNVMYVTPRSQKTFTSAGREISVLLAEQPGLDLRSLALLKTLVDQKVAPDDMHNTLVEIRTILWKLLPPSSPSPVIQGATVHALDQTFLNSLEGLRHE